MAHGGYRSLVLRSGWNLCAQRSGSAPSPAGISQKGTTQRNHVGTFLCKHFFGLSRFRNETNGPNRNIGALAYCFRQMHLIARPAGKLLQ